MLAQWRGTLVVPVELHSAKVVQKRSSGAKEYLLV